MCPTDYLSMDPNMLYSIANTKLRNDFDNVRELADALDVDRDALERRLAEHGFVYDPARNQFRPRTS